MPGSDSCPSCFDSYEIPENFLLIQEKRAAFPG